MLYSNGTKTCYDELMDLPTGVLPESYCLTCHTKSSLMLMLALSSMSTKVWNKRQMIHLLIHHSLSLSLSLSTSLLSEVSNLSDHILLPPFDNSVIYFPHPSFIYIIHTIFWQVRNGRKSFRWFQIEDGKAVVVDVERNNRTWWEKINICYKHKTK